MKNFMNDIYEVVIIGGGFSGTVAAIELARVYGENVALAERNARLCKKVSATGNGRCNITNASISVDRYHSVCGAKVADVLSRFGNNSLSEWLLSVGIPVSYEGEKAFPCSRQASSVAEALKDCLEFNGANIFYGFDCAGLIKHDGYFVATAKDGRKITAKRAIIACGGKAGRQYGSDGDGYVLAGGFGHGVTELFPSIVQLITERDNIKGLKGIKVVAEVSVYSEEKKIAASVGDVLFTDYGVSGNAVFAISSYVSGKNGLFLELSFLPELSEDELKIILVDKISSLPYADGDKLLCGFVHGALGRAVTARIGNIRSPYGKAVAIAKTLKHFRLNIIGTLGFDEAQVTHGGIRCSEVNEDTMESKLITGLYFTGEILDVDGDCGGFNLQWAYSSARAAAEDIIKNENR